MNSASEPAEVEGGKRRRRYTGKIEQAGHLASWERSGLSGAEYARIHGLKARDLYRWRKGQGRDSEHVSELEGSGEGFVTIDVNGRAFGGSGDGGLRVVLRRGSAPLPKFLATSPPTSICCIAASACAGLIRTILLDNRMTGTMPSAIS